MNEFFCFRSSTGRRSTWSKPEMLFRWEPGWATSGTASVSGNDGFTRGNTQLSDRCVVLMVLTASRVPQWTGRCWRCVWRTVRHQRDTWDRWVNIFRLSRVDWIFSLKIHKCLNLQIGRDPPACVARWNVSNLVKKNHCHPKETQFKLQAIIQVCK